jgi:hypothetical protein
VAPALLARGRVERTGGAGSAGGTGGAGSAGGAVNLVADTLRPLRVAVSMTGAATGTVASRDFR